MPSNAPSKSGTRTILVIGSTGNVGRCVVSELRRRGADVRALVRDPATAGLPAEVGVVRGDLSHVETIGAALEDIDAVFLVWPFMTADAAPAIVDVVAKNARHIVYLSSMGVRDDVSEQDSPINQFHAELERLIKRSTLEWTILRSSGFATNTLRWAPQLRSDGVVRGFYGAASRSLIHERDLATVAAHALTTDWHAGATHVLTGPQTLTQFEQATTIGEATSRPARYDEIAPEAARHELLAALPPAVVDGILAAHAAFVTQPEAVTRQVEDITGSPPRTFHNWALDHAADFR